MSGGTRIQGRGGIMVELSTEESIWVREKMKCLLNGRVPRPEIAKEVQQALAAIALSVYAQNLIRDLEGFVGRGGRRFAFFFQSRWEMAMQATYKAFQIYNFPIIIFQLGLLASFTNKKLAREFFQSFLDAQAEFEPSLVREALAPAIGFTIREAVAYAQAVLEFGDFVAGPKKGF